MAARALRAGWRLGRCGLKIIHGVLIGAFVLPRLSPAQRMVRVGRFCAQVIAILGVEVQAEGVPQGGPALLVANHTSWLDILAINAAHPARFVSKADVRAWPVMGWLVACGGTLFIQRERKRDALRVVHQIAESLTDGAVVAMFPEGTTSNGHTLLPFHANLLQAAISTGAPVQPIALAYRDAEHDPSRVVAWIGDMTLVGSMWSVVSADKLTVKVQLLPAVESAGRERRELSDTVRERIATALNIHELAPAAH